MRYRRARAERNGRRTRQLPRPRLWSGASEARWRQVMTMFRSPGTALAAIVAATIAAAAAAGPARAADPIGTWYTADKESQVRITNCGGALCGSLVWLKEPNDPATGHPKTDKNNADATKQSRPLIGVQIVLA